MVPGCPKCAEPLDKVPAHCPGDSHGSCWWGVHTCGAVIDLRRTSHWIDYTPTT